MNIPRVELNFDRATVAAYLMTAIDLVMMQAILMLRTRYRPALYIAAFLLSFSALVLTGTRAAMLVYPVAICLSLLATKQLVSENTSFCWSPRCHYCCSSADSSLKRRLNNALPTSKPTCN